jgi:ubiquinone/menaquinone biosynthesis C-methylase UbiE
MESRLLLRKLRWYGGILATHGLGYQSYLSQPWIEPLFKAVPKGLHRALGLRLLSMSPHYFIYMASSRYKQLRSLGEVFEAEYQRNLDARYQLVEQVLKPYLRPDMTVGDLGSGPGWMSFRVAPYVRHVHAFDNSPGVLAIARRLHHAENLTYHLTDGASLPTLPDGSLDLFYSFACVQHLEDHLLHAYLAEFFRVMRPGATALCHVMVGESQVRPDPTTAFEKFKSRFQLYCVYRRPKDLESAILGAGFADVKIKPMSELTDIEDDVREQHIVVFRRL